MDRLGLLVFLTLLLYVAHGTTIFVGPAGNIQTALNAAASPGDVISLQGCNYTILASSLNFSLPSLGCQGNAFNLEIAYLSFNLVDNVTLQGRSDCPMTGKTVINFVQDINASQYPLPCGFNIRSNFIHIDSIEPTFSVVGGIAPESCVYDICYTTAQLCDVGCCSLAIGNGTDTDFFPNYTPQDIANQSIIGTKVTNSHFTAYPQQCGFFYVAAPVAICNTSVNNNFFENDNLTIMVFRNSNMQLCGPGGLNWQFNCYTNVTQIYLTNPAIDPITYLPISQCNCITPDFPDGVPGPLYSLNPLVVYTSMQAAYASGVSVVYVGPGVLVLDQTILIDRPFTIIGQVNNTCDCFNGLHVAAQVNPAFLVLDKFLTVEQVRSVTFESESGFAIYRASTVLSLEGRNALQRYVINVSPALYQAYTLPNASAVAPGPVLIDQVNFDNGNATLNAIYALLFVDCCATDDTYNPEVRRSTFFSFPTAIYSRVGELQILKNTFRDTEETTFMGGGLVFGGGSAIVLDAGAADNQVFYNQFIDNEVGVKFTGAIVSSVECNVFINDQQADVLFQCGGFTDEVCFNCTAFAPALDECLTEFFAGSNCNDLIADFAACENEVDETNFFTFMSGCMASQNRPVNTTFLTFLHNKFLSQCVYSVSLGSTNVILMNYLNPSFQLQNITFFLCMWITESDFCNQFIVGPPPVNNTPTCSRSLGNEVEANVHVVALPYNHTGVVVPPGVQAFTDNIIEFPLPRFFHFQNQSALSLITQLVPVPPIPVNITLGVNKTCNSGRIIRTFVNPPSPARFQQGTYVDTDPECRPPRTFPQTLFAAQNFGTGTIPGNCSTCVVEFTMSPACFHSRQPVVNNATSNLTCNETMILGMNTDISWTQLPTTAVNCNASLGDYVWTTPCVEGDDMYVLGALDANIYALCAGADRETFISLVSGTVVTSLQEAINIVPDGGTIFLSDGMCCCDECIVNKTIHFVSFYTNDTSRIGEMSCCPDLAGNQCKFVLGFAQNSHFSSVTGIWVHDVWTDGRDNPLPHPVDAYDENGERRSCAFYTGDSIPLFSNTSKFDFLPQVDDQTMPIHGLVFNNSYFSCMQCGITLHNVLNVTISNNQFGAGPRACPSTRPNNNRRFPTRDLTAPPAECTESPIVIFANGAHASRSCEAGQGNLSSSFIQVRNNSFMNFEVGVHLLHADPIRKQHNAHLCKQIEVAWQLLIQGNDFLNPKTAGIHASGVSFIGNHPFAIDSNHFTCNGSSSVIPPSLLNTSLPDLPAAVGLLRMENVFVNGTNTFQGCQSHINGRKVLWMNSIHHQHSDLHITNAIARNNIDQCSGTFQPTNITITNVSLFGSLISHDSLPHDNSVSSQFYPNLDGVNRAQVTDTTLDYASSITGFTENSCTNKFKNLIVLRSKRCNSTRCDNIYEEAANRSLKYVWDHDKNGLSKLIPANSFLSFNSASQRYTTCPCKPFTDDKCADGSPVPFFISTCCPVPQTFLERPSPSSSSSSSSSASSDISYPSDSSDGSSATTDDTSYFVPMGAGSIVTVGGDATSNTSSSSLPSSDFRMDDEFRDTMITVFVVLGGIVIAIALIICCLFVCSSAFTRNQNQNTFTTATQTRAPAVMDAVQQQPAASRFPEHKIIRREVRVNF